MLRGNHDSSKRSAEGGSGLRSRVCFDAPPVWRQTDRKPTDAASQRELAAMDWPHPLCSARSQARDLTGSNLEVEADRIVDQGVGRDTRRLRGASHTEAQRKIDPQVGSLP
jgi:hypothetical protein